MAAQKFFGRVVALKTPRKQTCGRSFNDVGGYKTQVSMELKVLYSGWVSMTHPNLHIGRKANQTLI